MTGEKAPWVNEEVVIKDLLKTVGKILARRGGVFNTAPMEGKKNRDPKRRLSGKNWVSKKGLSGTKGGERDIEEGKNSNLKEKICSQAGGSICDFSHQGNYYPKGVC